MEADAQSPLLWQPAATYKFEAPETTGQKINILRGAQLHTMSQSDQHQLRENVNTTKDGGAEGDFSHVVPLQVTGAGDPPLHDSHRAEGAVDVGQYLRSVERVKISTMIETAGRGQEAQVIFEQLDSPIATMGHSGEGPDAMHVIQDAHPLAGLLNQRLHGGDGCQRLLAHDIVGNQQSTNTQTSSSNAGVTTAGTTGQQGAKIAASSIKRVTKAAPSAKHAPTCVLKPRKMGTSAPSREASAAGSQKAPARLQAKLSEVKPALSSTGRDSQRKPVEAKFNSLAATSPCTAEVGVSKPMSRTTDAEARPNAPAKCNKAAATGLNKLASASPPLRNVQSSSPSASATLAHNRHVSGAASIAPHGSHPSTPGHRLAASLSASSKATTDTGTAVKPKTVGKSTPPTVSALVGAVAGPKSDIVSRRASLPSKVMTGFPSGARSVVAAVGCKAVPKSSSTLPAASAVKAVAPRASPKTATPGAMSSAVSSTLMRRSRPSLTTAVPPSPASIAKPVRKEQTAALLPKPSPDTAARRTPRAISAKSSEQPTAVKRPRAEGTAAPGASADTQPTSTAPVALRNRLVATANNLSRRCSAPPVPLRPSAPATGRANAAGAAATRRTSLPAIAPPLPEKAPHTARISSAAKESVQAKPIGSSATVRATAVRATPLSATSAEPLAAKLVAKKRMESAKPASSKAAKVMVPVKPAVKSGEKESNVALPANCEFVAASPVSQHVFVADTALETSHAGARIEAVVAQEWATDVLMPPAEVATVPEPVLGAEQQSANKSLAQKGIDESPGDVPCTPVAAAQLNDSTKVDKVADVLVIDDSSATTPLVLIGTQTIDSPQSGADSGAQPFPSVPAAGLLSGEEFVCLHVEHTSPDDVAMEVIGGIIEHLVSCAENAAADAADVDVLALNVATPVFKLAPSTGPHAVMASPPSVDQWLPSRSSEQFFTPMENTPSHSVQLPSPTSPASQLPAFHTPLEVGEAAASPHSFVCEVLGAMSQEPAPPVYQSLLIGEPGNGEHLSLAPPHPPGVAIRPRRLDFEAASGLRPRSQGHGQKKTSISSSASPSNPAAPAWRAAGSISRSLDTHTVQRQSPAQPAVAGGQGHMRRSHVRASEAVVGAVASVKPLTSSAQGSARAAPPAEPGVASQPSDVAVQAVPVAIDGSIAFIEVSAVEGANDGVWGTQDGSVATENVAAVVIAVDMQPVVGGLAAAVTASGANMEALGLQRAIASQEQVACSKGLATAAGEAYPTVEPTRSSIAAELEVVLQEMADLEEIMAVSDGTPTTAAVRDTREIVPQQLREIVERPTLAFFNGGGPEDWLITRDNNHVRQVEEQLPAAIAAPSTPKLAIPVDRRSAAMARSVGDGAAATEMPDTMSNASRVPVGPSTPPVAPSAARAARARPASLTPPALRAGAKSSGKANVVAGKAKEPQRCSWPGPAAAAPPQTTFAAHAHVHMSRNVSTAPPAALVQLEKGKQCISGGKASLHRPALAVEPMLPIVSSSVGPRSSPARRQRAARRSYNGPAGADAAALPLTRDLVAPHSSNGVTALERERENDLLLAQYGAAPDQRPGAWSTEESMLDDVKAPEEWGLWQPAAARCGSSSTLDDLDDVELTEPPTRGAPAVPLHVPRLDVGAAIQQSQLELAAMSVSPTDADALAWADAGADSPSIAHSAMDSSLGPSPAPGALPQDDDEGQGSNQAHVARLPGRLAVAAQQVSPEPEAEWITIATAQGVDAVASLTSAAAARAWTPASAGSTETEWWSAKALMPLPLQQPVSTHGYGIDWAMKVQAEEVAGKGGMDKEESSHVAYEQLGYAAAIAAAGRDEVASPELVELDVQVATVIEPPVASAAAGEAFVTARDDPAAQQEVSSGNNSTPRAVRVCSLSPNRAVAVARPGAMGRQDVSSARETFTGNLATNSDDTRADRLLTMKAQQSRGPRVPLLHLAAIAPTSPAEVGLDCLLPQSPGMVQPAPPQLRLPVWGRQAIAPFLAGASESTPVPKVMFAVPAFVSAEGGSAGEAAPSQPHQGGRRRAQARRSKEVSPPQIAMPLLDLSHLHDAPGADPEFAEPLPAPRNRARSYAMVAAASSSTAPPVPAVQAHRWPQH